MHAVRLVSHMYWPGKAQFALDEDTYDYWTIFAVESGSFAYRIGDSEGRAGFGDLAVCPPRVPFHRQVVEPLSFHFLHVEPADARIAGGVEGRRVEGGRYTLADSGRLIRNYELMRGAGRRSEDERLTLRQHAVNDIWLLALLERDEPPGGEEAVCPTSGDAAMDQARAYMLEHACELLQLRELAALLQLTPVQLTRRFRAAFGMTPIDYVTELRLERVCRLLQDTSLSLEQIAPQCGYENGYYLSRVFTKKKGISPSRYRKLCQV